MIPSDELAQWLEDPAAQGRTARAAEAVGRAIKDEPALLRLQSDLAAVEGGGAAAALAAAQQFLDDGHGVGTCLDRLIRAALEDPFFRPPLRTGSGDVHAAILLFDHPALSLFLSVATVEALAAKRVLKAGAASISFPGTRSLFKFLRAGDATLSLWEAAPANAGFSGAESGPCRLAERRRLRDGETLALDGRRQTFVIDHAAADLVYLHAVTPYEAAPLTVEYDAATLAFVGASSTDEASSRTQMMLSLLRAMDRRDAATVFASVLRDAPFFARWATMREFLALDAEAAAPHLRDMAKGDPHPEVRAAALQTLSLLDDGEDAPREEMLCPA